MYDLMGKRGRARPRERTSRDRPSIRVSLLLRNSKTPSLHRSTGIKAQILSLSVHDGRRRLLVVPRKVRSMAMRPIALCCALVVVASARRLRGPVIHCENGPRTKPSAGSCRPARMETRRGQWRDLDEMGISIYCTWQADYDKGEMTRSFDAHGFVSSIRCSLRHFSWGRRQASSRRRLMDTQKARRFRLPGRRVLDAGREEWRTGPARRRALSGQGERQHRAGRRDNPKGRRSDRSEEAGGAQVKRSQLAGRQEAAGVEDLKRHVNTLASLHRCARSTIVSSSRAHGLESSSIRRRGRFGPNIQIQPRKGELAGDRVDDIDLARVEARRERAGVHLELEDRRLAVGGVE